MSDGQINRLLHLLERIATALERANPQPVVMTGKQAQYTSGTAIDPRYVPSGNVVSLTPADVTKMLNYPHAQAGSHDPV